MNERIKELAEQAGMTNDKFGMYFAKDFDSHCADGVDLEKFADLIVQECAEQSMSIGRYNTPGGNTPDLAIAIAVGLKKHFGVE